MAYEAPVFADSFVSYATIEIIGLLMTDRHWLLFAVDNEAWLVRCSMCWFS